MPTKKNEKLSEEQEKKINDRLKDIFKDTLKTYYETDPKSDKDNAFYGEKYKDPAKRKKPCNYSLYRFAGISVSVFALAATGRYTLEDLMDNDKLRDEKAKMYEKVAECMYNETPENQAWIAKQIYEGQKATNRLMTEAAKTIDFSDPNIMQNKTFCRMLHMGFLQFDAWQEMAHCKNEILELAKADHPEMKKWEDYKNWWTKNQNVMEEMHTIVSKQRELAKNVLINKNGRSISDLALLVTFAGYKKFLFTRLAKAQKDAVEGGLSFEKWISEEDKMKSAFLNTGIIQKEYEGRLNYIEDEPETCNLLIKSIVNGEFTKDLDIDLDLQTFQIKIEGMPSEEKVRELTGTQKKQKVNEVKEQKNEKANTIANEPEDNMINGPKAGEKIKQGNNAIEKHYSQDYAKNEADILVSAIKRVDFNLAGKGSQQFKDMKDALIRLQDCAYCRGGREKFEPEQFYLCQKEAIRMVNSYLNYKQDQFKDITRRDSAKRQKHEQPRIYVAIQILEHLSNESEIVGKGLNLSPHQRELKDSLKEIKETIDELKDNMLSHQTKTKIEQGQLETINPQAEALANAGKNKQSKKSSSTVKKTVTLQRL